MKLETILLRTIKHLTQLGDLSHIFLLVLLIILPGAPLAIAQEDSSQKRSKEPEEWSKFAPNETPTYGVEIEKWDFGIVTDRSGPSKDWKLHPVVVIPNLPGIQYAWKLKIKPQNPVFVREEFTLPEAPSSWRIKQDETSSQLLNGGEQCVLENFQTTDEGWIGHAWSASRGDPAGKYEIKIWLNRKLAHTFVFNVGDASEDDKDGRDI